MLAGSAFSGFRIWEHGASARALSWPEQGKGPPSAPSCPPAPVSQALARTVTLGGWAWGPLTLTTESLSSQLLLSRAALAGRTPTAEGPDVASLTGDPPPRAPQNAGAPLTQPRASAAAPKVWCQMGLVWFCFCLGGWVIAVLGYVSLATKKSCINCPWMMKFKESINRSTKCLVPIGSCGGLPPATSALPTPVGRSGTQRPRRELRRRAGPGLGCSVLVRRTGALCESSAL